MNLRWSHCVMYVRDLDGMIDFYDKILGFKVADRGLLDRNNPQSPEVAFLSGSGTDHHQIAFAPVRGDGPSTTLDHIAFRVDSFNDVKAMIEKVQADPRASGVGLVNHGNAWSVYFMDPEENRIEVFCDSPFDVQQPQLDGWEFEMSEAEMRKATEEKFSGEGRFGPMDEYKAEQTRKLGG